MIDPSRGGGRWRTICRTEFGAGDPVSAGQRQRIAIARELLARKPCLILDEPTAALDVEASTDLARELSRLPRAGR